MLSEAERCRVERIGVELGVTCGGGAVDNAEYCRYTVYYLFCVRFNIRIFVYLNYTWTQLVRITDSFGC